MCLIVIFSGLGVENSKTQGWMKGETGGRHDAVRCADLVPFISDCSLLLVTLNNAKAHLLVKQASYSQL
jgi:hypothetical protein